LGAARHFCASHAALTAPGRGERAGKLTRRAHPRSRRAQSDLEAAFKDCKARTLALTLCPPLARL